LIRRARYSDAASIAAIWNPIIRETTITFTSAEKTTADIEALIKTQPVWVLEDGHGFATLGLFRAGPGYRFTQEHSVHLTPSARGQGMGRALMAVVEAHARDAGHHSVMAGISGENTGAVAFHRKLGFSKVAHLPKVGWKFERWHDLILMQKFL